MTIQKEYAVKNKDGERLGNFRCFLGQWDFYPEPGVILDIVRLEFITKEMGKLNENNK